MHYFAGLFDAEGYITLSNKGAFCIGIEMANEDIPNMFKKQFGGSIYIRQREKRKKTWAWKINSIADQSINFINSIVDFSHVKNSQLKRLKDYLDQSRQDRKLTREFTFNSLRLLKQPILEISHILPSIPKQPTKEFFQWLAGFTDGDGNFVCNEYIDNRNNRKYFSHQMSIANIFLESICFINDRIEGSILTCKRPVNSVFKWVPNREHEKFVCESIYPFLIIKKKQCELFLEFIEFPAKARDIPYPNEVLSRMYEITHQIKHLNSL